MSVWTSSETGLPPLAASPSHVLINGLARAAFKARLVLALTGGLFAALLMLLALTPGPQRASAVNDPEIGAWTRKPDGPARLAIRSTAFAGLPQSGAVWTRTHGSFLEIEDRLIVGDVEAKGPFLLIAAARPAPEAVETSLFIASARLAANEGLSVSRFAPAVTTAGTGRFGAMETARVTLSKVFPAAAPRESCLSWRATASAQVVLSGLLCPASGETIADEQFDCILRDLVALPAADTMLREALTPVAAPVGCRSPVPARTARKG